MKLSEGNIRVLKSVWRSLWSTAILGALAAALDLLTNTNIVATIVSQLTHNPVWGGIIAVAVLGAVKDVIRGLITKIKGPIA